MKILALLLLLAQLAWGQYPFTEDDGLQRVDGKCEICTADIFSWQAKPNTPALWGNDGFGFVPRPYREPETERVMSVGFIPVKMCEPCFTKFNTKYTDKMKRLHDKLLADFMDEQTERRTEIETIRRKQAEVDKQKRIRELEQEIWGLNHPEEARKRVIIKPSSVRSLNSGQR